MARTRFINNASGFTMIEVLAAIAILAIGLMAMGALQTSSLRRTGNVARRTEALTHLAQQAGVLKQMPFYLDVNAKTFPPALTAGGFGAPRSVASPDGRYTIQWRVDENLPFGAPFPQTVLPGVPVGNYTVSKRITMVAFRTGGNPANPLAQVEFFKVWWATGVP